MSALLRALHLRDLRRHEEAVAHFLQHLAAHPDDAEAHAQLAVTRLEMPGERRKALESIDAALALAPDEAECYAIRALILCELDRDDEALATAESAVRIDPELVLGWVAQAQAHAGKSRWAEAEAAAQHALQLDPEHPTAQNLLAWFQRMQGKLDEADRGTGERLARDPEDATAHANAGWAALHRHDQPRAEEHFREALRLDPELEYARIGLREAYKARSAFYRGFLRWVFWMQKFSDRQRFLLIIGIFLAYKFGQVLLETVHPVAVAVLAIVYVVFVFSGYLASGLMHFLLLKDRHARLTLNRREKLDGLFVGGGFFVGVLLVITGLLVAHPGVAVLGGALALGAIPGSLVFVNDSRSGRVVFGSILALLYVAGLTSLVQDLLRGEPFAAPAKSLIGFAVLGAVASTWLSQVPSLREGSPE